MDWDMSGKDVIKGVLRDGYGEPDDSENGKERAVAQLVDVPDEGQGQEDQEPDDAHDALFYVVLGEHAVELVEINDRVEEVAYGLAVRHAGAKAKDYNAALDCRRSPAAEKTLRDELEARQARARGRQHKQPDRERGGPSADYDHGQPEPDAHGLKSQKSLP